MRTGTLGPNVVDISSLYPVTGCFTYDAGFTSTASCELVDISSAPRTRTIRAHLRADGSPILGLISSLSLEGFKITRITR